MKLSTLSEWLNWIKKIHIKDIDLGLQRIQPVAQHLNLLPTKVPTVVVAGTNGKGSVIASLEAIYSEQGYQTGAFTSPFLFSFNEQIRINKNPVSEQALCEAFNLVEAGRGTISLSPFEYTTLAALTVFQQYELDLLLLEIGLGGRLDAVNIVDADVAVITSIGIDHTEWLGNTREAIALEKAGILRANQLVVCGDFDPPITLREEARRLSTNIAYQGRDFIYLDTGASWNWQTEHRVLSNLPKNNLALQNLSTALKTIEFLDKRLPVDEKSIRQGISNTKWPARQEVIEGDVMEVRDVSHNPAAIQSLASFLESLCINGKIYAVFSMLNDKDISASIKSINTMVDHWFIGELNTERATKLEKLSKCFQEASIEEVTEADNLKDAYQNAKAQAKKGDCIVVFGSFHTVAEAYVKAV